MRLNFVRFLNFKINVSGVGRAWRGLPATSPLADLFGPAKLACKIAAASLHSGEEIWKWLTAYRVPSAHTVTVSGMPLCNVTRLIVDFKQETRGKTKTKHEHETARKTQQYVKESTEQHGKDYNLHSTEWHAMLAQHANTTRHGKQLEHQHKTRHYTEMTRTQQTKHGATRNKQSTLEQKHGITRKHVCYAHSQYVLMCTDVYWCAL